MRRSRLVVAATVVLAVVLLLVLTVPAMAGPQRVIAPRDGSAALQGPGWVDGTYMQGDKEKDFRALAAKVGAKALAQGAATLTPAAYVGMQFGVYVSNMDPDHPGMYPETFVVQSIGTHGIICVTKAAWDGFDGSYYRFANPNGDPTSSDPWERMQDVVTPSQLSYLLGQFDTNIWNTESTVFGTPLPRGADGQKVYILVYNIIDESYYDTSAGTYVAGYFSGSEDADNTKNMIHIDTYDWIDRIGPNVARPYVYEEVFAHEYQHLLHADTDPDEDSWIDEGMAELAGFLCGYMEDNSHVEYYLVFHPFTSLTFWGGGLENYGADYLFQLYLYENYGGAKFSKALFQDQANGIEGVQNELNRFGKGVSFSKVFDNWTLANYFDRKGPSQYGYKNIDLGPDTYGWTIPDALTYYWGVAPLSAPFKCIGSEFWGETYYSPDPWEPIAPQPYTAQYYLFDKYPTLTVALDGDDEAGVQAHSGTYEMASGQGAWAWKSLYLDNFAVPGTGATLSFWTWFDCEPNYDYGYVEIHDLTAGQWYTMPVLDDSTNEITITDTDSDGQVNPNVPEGRNPKDYMTAGRWHAFNGSSSGLAAADPNGWVHGTVNLNQFENHTIDMFFRTWQDGAFTLQMMYLDDIRLQYGATDWTENFDLNTSQWLTPHSGDTGAWTLGTGLVSNNWQGTLVSIGQSPVVSPRIAIGDLPPVLKVWATPMNGATQAGTVYGTQQFKQVPQWLYIVSNRAGHIIASDYTLRAWR